MGQKFTTGVATKMRPRPSDEKYRFPRSTVGTVGTPLGTVETPFTTLCSQAESPPPENCSRLCFVDREGGKRGTVPKLKKWVNNLRPPRWGPWGPRLGSTKTPTFTVYSPLGTVGTLFGEYITLSLQTRAQRRAGWERTIL